MARKPVNVAAAIINVYFRQLPRVQSNCLFVKTNMLNGPMHGYIHKTAVFSSLLASFLSFFTAASLTAFNLDLNTEELVFLFNHTYHTVLVFVAPYRDKQSNRTPQ